MKLTVFAGLLAAASISSAADAALLQFNITGDYTASFQLDSNATPDDFDANGTIFYDVPGSFEGADGNGVVDVEFYSQANSGGIGFFDFDGNGTLLVTDGPQIYSGSEAMPVFSPGAYALRENTGFGTYNLTISNLTAAVPEPATWAMMIGGIGMAGGMMRRRRRATTVHIAYA